MAVQTVTNDRMPVAHAGMIADTALRQVDGATAAELRLYIGFPAIVSRGDNNTKVVRHVLADDLVNLSGKLLGVTLFSHWANVTGFYEIGDAVNVMRVGRIWAVTPLASAPAAGAQVRLAIGTGSQLPVCYVTNTGGTVIPGWQFTGELETQADGTHIARIELTVPQIAAPASGS